MSSTHKRHFSFVVALLVTVWCATGAIGILHADHHHEHHVDGSSDCFICEALDAPANVELAEADTFSRTLVILAKTVAPSSHQGPTADGWQQRAPPTLS